jgi:hypothetical protein
MDIALWGAPALATSTLEVEGTATFPEQGLANTSISWQVTARTADGVTLRFADDAHQRHGCRFVGDRGSVLVDRSGIWAEPASLLGVTLRPEDEHLYDSKNHLDDFLQCLRTRRDPVSPVESGHAATTLTIVADIATRTGRKLVWDWRQERFVNDDGANRFLRRPMRSPWHV